MNFKTASCVSFLIFFFTINTSSIINTSLVSVSGVWTLQEQKTQMFISKQPWEKERKYSVKDHLGAFFEQVSMLLPTTLTLLGFSPFLLLHRAWNVLLHEDSCWNNDWVRLSSIQSLSLIISAHGMTLILLASVVSKMCFSFPHCIQSKTEEHLHSVALKFQISHREGLNIFNKITAVRVYPVFSRQELCLGSTKVAGYKQFDKEGAKARAELLRQGEKWKQSSGESSPLLFILGKTLDTPFGRCFYLECLNETMRAYRIQQGSKPWAWKC